jgi:hypothetical protein
VAAFSRRRKLDTLLFSHFFQEKNCIKNFSALKSI